MRKLTIPERASFLKKEPRTLLTLAGMSALLLVLAKIVEDVVTLESGGFDRAVLEALRVPGHPDLPIGAARLEPFFLNITALGSPAVITLLTIVTAGYLALGGQRRLAGVIVVSIALGAIAETLLKLGFHRARPDVVTHLVTVHSPSFPSGHATLSAMCYLTVAALLARRETRWRMRVFVMGIGVAATLLIGFSRVYLGVHWPTDVLAGWSIGALWALATWWIVEIVT